jgi:DNA repair exonuclease SbcCD ATPase subunit
MRTTAESGLASPEGPELISGSFATGRRAVDESADVEERTVAAIRAKNREFQEKTDAQLALPIPLLTEQRDQALRQLEHLTTRARLERESLIAEQDAFIVSLTEDHQRDLAKLEQQLAQARTALDRQAVLSAPPSSSLREPSSTDARLLEAAERIDQLAAQLETAYRELDESLKENVRLQGERDDAVQAVEEVRIELNHALDLARDDITRLELEAAETNRLLDDTRDRAREEQCRVLEELEAARRELDERREEVRLLLERVEEESPPTRLPLPTQAAELERARGEAKIARKQLVEAKREVARLSRELELARSPRRASSIGVIASGRVGGGTRTGTTLPGVSAPRHVAPGSAEPEQKASHGQGD